MSSDRSPVASILKVYRHLVLPHVAALLILHCQAIRTVRDYPLLCPADAVLVFIGQWSRLFAFLVPIKVLYIAATPHMPSVFRPYTGDLSKESVVMLLALSAAMLYLVAHLCESGSKKIKRDIGQQIDQRGHVRLAPGESRDLNRKAYKQVVNYLAVVLFQVTLLPLNLLLVDYFWPLLVSTLVLAYAMCVFGRSGYTEGGESTGTQVLSSWQSLSFLMAFGFVLYALLQDPFPSALMAVIALVCVRLQINQSALLVRILVSRVQSGEREGQHHAIGDSTASDPFQSSLILPAGGPLAECLNTAAPLDTGKPRVRAFLVTSNRQTYLIKQYLGSEKQAGAREAANTELLQSCGLAPVLCQVSTDPLSVSHAYSGVKAPIPMTEHDAAREAFLAHCLGVVPSDEWRNYASKPPVTERLKLPPLSDLPAGGEAARHWARFTQTWPQIQARLKAAPQQVVLRSGPGLLAYGEQDRVIAMYWDAVAVEPVGVSWEGETYLSDPTSAFEAARVIRPDIADTPLALFRLGYAAGRLEAALIRRNMYRATALVREMLGYWNELR